MAAGLGFKDFVTGEVLTAADVDGYLMQGVWVFASAAARTAAVPSPQEGNMSFLKDTNSTEYYSGSAWVAVAGGGGSSTTSAVFSNSKASGTDDGTFTSGAWRTRDLNTTDFNNITSASLASNQITLPAGTYNVIGNAPAFKVNNHQSRWYNITDSAVVQLGQNAYVANGALNTTISPVNASFTIAASKVFELQHRCTTTVTSEGFGVNAGWGTEVYSTVQITKVA
jgi:hypothetical protein